MALHAEIVVAKGTVRHQFLGAATVDPSALVAEEVAMKYATPTPPPNNATGSTTAPTFLTNWRTWLNFLSGKPISNNEQ